MQRKSEAVFGESVRPMACRCTPTRRYAAAGIPTVLYGAGARRLTEAPTPWTSACPFPDLRKATEVVARTLLDLLRGR